MCKEEDYVVPTKPSACMGWWVGEVIRVYGNFVDVHVIWAQVSKYVPKNGAITATADYLNAFDNTSDVLAHLRGVGVLPEMPVC